MIAAISKLNLVVGRILHRGRPEPNYDPSFPRVWDLHQLSGGELCSRITFLLLASIVLVVGAVCLINAVAEVGKPFHGFHVNQRLVVTGVGQNQWTGIRAGLKFPDRIVKVNGVPVSSIEEFGKFIEELPVGTKVVYTIDRDDKLVTVTVLTMSLSWTDFFLTFGLTFFSGLVYWAIGVVVFILKPDTQSSWAFLSACFLVSVYTITGLDDTRINVVRISLFAQSFVPAAFVYLSLLFPERRRIIDRFRYLQGLPFVVSAVLALPLVYLYPSRSFLPYYKLVFVYLASSTIFVVVATVSSYFASASALAKQRAKTVLFGAALALPIPAVILLLSFSGVQLVGTAIQNNFLAIPVLIFPASIAYAIARHNLFDVDVYIKRAVGYVIMTAILGAGYLSIQTVINKFVFKPLFGDFADEIYPIVFALLVVFCFNPINRRIQDVIDRVFFRKTLDYKETVRSVSNALTSLLNLDEILARVVGTVRTEMFVDTVGLIVLNHESRTCQAYFAGDESRDTGENGVVNRQISYDDPLLTLISNEKALVTKYDIREDPCYREFKDVCGKSFADLGVSLALPMVYRDVVMGALILGNKKSGHFYSREDVDLLVTMVDEAAVAIENAKLAEQMKREEGVRANLARYLSPQIVDQIVKNNVEVNLGGDKKVVTVLFSDIRNFTTITESRKPDELVQQLNEYFTEMAGIIFEHGGSLDKYIGDAIVAVFGSLIDLENSAQNAAQAALKMMRRLPVLNESWLQKYGLEMEFGIGLSTGEVFLGNIGSPERMEFTVIGDTVNVASRFSGLAKAGQILMTRETLNCLGAEFNFKEHPPTKVKGKTGELQVFELLSS